MRKLIKKFIPNSILEARDKKRLDEQAKLNYSEWRKREYQEWEKSECPVPPPHAVKQITIAEFQEKSGYSILAETGTYMGDMIEAQKRIFKRLFSIELGQELYENAVKRFQNDKHVSIFQGDSGKVLADIIKLIDKPAIFWLDGHYSAGITAKGDKECPIFEELDAIFNGKKLDHILLIDDARCFVGENDYPTIENLKKYISAKNSNYKMEVKNDVICFTL